jgi:hypothetical protein
VMPPVGDSRTEPGRMEKPEVVFGLRHTRINDPVSQPAEDYQDSRAMMEKLLGDLNDGGELEIDEGRSDAPKTNAVSSRRLDRTAEVVERVDYGVDLNSRLIARTRPRPSLYGRTVAQKSDKTFWGENGSIIEMSEVNDDHH